MPGAEKVGEFAIWYVVFLLTLTIHEGAHALVAWMGGDDTAYRGGQVSLNPWPHVRREPFGTVLVPLLTFMWSGWMMGWASAPYNPSWGRRYPRRLAAMSAAGPAANFLLMAGAFVAIRIGLGAGRFVAPGEVNFSHVVGVPPGTPDGSLLYAAAFTLSVALNLNLLLFLFNLIPLPPLDGSGVLQGLFPATAGRLYGSLAGNPMLSLFGLLVAWRIFGYTFGPAFKVLLVLLYPDVSYS